MENDLTELFDLEYAKLINQAVDNLPEKVSLEESNTGLQKNVRFLPRPVNSEESIRCHNCHASSGRMVDPISGRMVEPVSGRSVEPISGRMVEPISGRMDGPISGENASSSLCLQPGMGEERIGETNCETVQKIGQSIYFFCENCKRHSNDTRVDLPQTKNRTTILQDRECEMGRSQGRTIHEDGEDKQSGGNDSFMAQLGRSTQTLDDKLKDSQSSATTIANDECGYAHNDRNKENDIIDECADINTNKENNKIDECALNGINKRNDIIDDCAHNDTNKENNVKDESAHENKMYDAADQNYESSREGNGCDEASERKDNNCDKASEGHENQESVEGKEICNAAVKDSPKSSKEDDWFAKADELEKRIIEGKVSMADFFKLRDEAFGHLKSAKSRPVASKITVERKVKRPSNTDLATKKLVKDLTPVRRSNRILARKNDKIRDEQKQLDVWKRKKIPFEFSPREEDFVGFTKTDVESHPYFPYFIVASRKRKYREVGDDEEYKPKKRSSFRCMPVPVLEITDISDAMIKNLAKRSSDKVKDLVNGTSCHQCRQKTRDTKTVCRSGRCTGLRGQFCAICLLNRYGEKAIDVLFDEKWECPPCRDICNCSICRAEKGLPPTGILKPVAEAKGYNSVHDYLEKEMPVKRRYIYGKKGRIEVEVDDFINDN